MTFPKITDTQWSIADLMEQGLYYMHKKDKKLYAQNLITARQYFANAQNTLTSFKPDPAQSVSVLYQLMNVEFEMAFNRDMSAEEKISHLQKAEQYGWDASGYARQSSNAGDSAHVKLFLGVIKGRKAEVHAKLGVSPEDIRKQKDEALSEIFIAMKEVRESGHVNLKQSIDFSTTWTQRLKEPMPEPQTNIPFRAELGLTSTLF